MPNPSVIPSMEFFQGEDIHIPLRFQDADGNNLSLIASGADATLRLRHRNGGNAVVRKKSNGPTEFMYPTGEDGSTGGIVFLIDATDGLALSLGLYKVEAVYENSTSPGVKAVKGYGWLQLLAPRTGTL